MRTFQHVDTVEQAQAHRWPLDVLIAGAREGKDAHIGELFRRFHEDLYAPLYGVAPDVAWDAVSETFLELPRHLERYTDDGRFLGWLRVLAWNRARTLRRSIARKREVEFPESWDRARTGTPMRTMEADMVRRELLSVLTPQEREFWTAYENGLSSVELGERFGKSANAIDQWRFRVRAKLQKRAAALQLAPGAWPTPSPARTRRDASAD
ncbi:MAG: sigma-70 family RNA polymerase sigma factor [Gemmatimonadaceae bacterium]|jgi:RNA polymerase sigma factor (sigma-70 family)|nr:sigma-70 family RNA polymerase sigma factor [Gemmatimonadaceae bacterium]